MSNRFLRAACSFAIVSGLLLCAPCPADEPLNEKLIKALRLSIEDEIYALGKQQSYEFVGKQTAPDLWQVPLFVGPSLHNGQGYVIYKLMPIGEVYRSFYLLKDGDVFLDGDPEGHFPPTHSSSYLTVYMEDQQLCALKNSSRVDHFEITTSPTASMVKQAKVRHERREPIS